jgi:adenine/guanine phosphoribosyltransferase-like PRPP-binding protein
LRKAIDHYATQLNNYYVSFGLFRLYVIGDRPSIRSIFGSSPEASFLNRNFTASHDLTHTIDSVDPPTREWEVIHMSVKSAISDLGDEPIRRLNQMFEEGVRESFPNEIDLLEFTDSIVRRWFYIVFVGHEPIEPFNVIDPEERVFYDIREMLLRDLRHSFYDNRFRWVPIIGSVTAKFWNRNKTHSLRNLMQLFLKVRPEQFPNSFYGRFKQHTHQNVDRLYPELTDMEKLQLADLIFVNNSLLSVLVYDFIHMMVMGCVIQKVNRGRDSLISEMDDSDIDTIYRSNFLFKYRGRRLTRDVRVSDEGGEGDEHIIPSGSIVIADLLKSGLFYSSGARGCAGQALARPLIKSFVELLNSMEIIVVEDRLIRSDDPDVPIVDLDRSDVRGYLYHRDQLKRSDMIPSIEKTNGVILRNLWHIYSDPDLMIMIRRWIELVDRFAFQSRANSPIIVAPEARALPIASMFGRPLVVMTKDDKFGPTHSQSYTRGYNADSKYLHMYDTFESDLKRHDSYVLVDDGIASGQTLKTCMQILDSFDNRTHCSAIVGIIDHSYTETDESIQRENVITMFDF